MFENWYNCIKAILSRGTVSIIFYVYYKSACVYVGLKVFHAACIILYTCKSSLHFILVLYFGGGGCL